MNDNKDIDIPKLNSDNGNNVNSIPTFSNGSENIESNFEPVNQDVESDYAFEGLNISSISDVQVEEKTSAISDGQVEENTSLNNTSLISSNIINESKEEVNIIPSDDIELAKRNDNVDANEEPSVLSNLNNENNEDSFTPPVSKPYNALSGVDLHLDSHNNDSKPDENKYVLKPKGIYYSYTLRVLTYLGLFFVLLFIANYLAFNSFTSVDEERVNYTEKSNLNYQVLLKDNEFYDNNYLDQNMVYVASLIDSINVIFNYDFVADKEINLLFNYHIVAKVVIYDETEKNIFYQKEYPLLENQSVKIENGKFRNISEIVDIDYAKYNTIANEFKNTYGLETVSKLLVELHVDKVNAETSQPVAAETSNIVLSIPLSERAINIQMDYQDINNQSEIITDASLSVTNYLMMAGAVVLLVAGIYAGVKLTLLLIKLLPRSNAFDDYIDKIIREYDRLVVTTTTKPNLSNKKCEIIRIHSFDEILDVRDNLKMPVMWYLISPHNKGCFYIKDNNTIYIYYVKKSILEKKKEK